MNDYIDNHIQFAIQKCAKIQQILSDGNNPFEAALECEAIAAQISDHLYEVLHTSHND